jgi:excisionase family DNA binding protein
MTVADVARILRLNQQTVYNWIDRGELAAHHVGRSARIRRADFYALVDAGYSEPPKAREPAPSIWDGAIPLPIVP